MHILTELLKEHSAAQAKRIAVYACESEAHFAELMECYGHADYRISQRAAWAFCHAAKHAKHLITLYVPLLIEQIQRPDVHVAVIRNGLRILEGLPTLEELHGGYYEYLFCFYRKRRCACRS